MQAQQLYFILLDVLLLIAPFLANLYFKIPGLKTVFVNYLRTYSVVGVIFTIFTSFLTSTGSLNFNTKLMTNLGISNLPIEVIIFLFAMPFASIALYELINFKFKDKRILLDKTIFYLFAFTYLVLAVIFSPHSDTSLLFLLLSVLTLAVSYFKKNNVFLTKNFYLFSLLSIIPFIVTAFILTSTPYVTYAGNGHTGFNIGTIPFEEFFTSFFVLSTFLTVYYLFKKREA